TEVSQGVFSMAIRSSWKGCLQLSLVCVPVKAYSTSSSGGGEIHLNQLHADCHRRIQYKKTCPLHGEVINDQIVSGYEYAQDHYVVVDPDELDRLRTERTRPSRTKSPTHQDVPRMDLSTRLLTLEN